MVAPIVPLGNNLEDEGVEKRDWIRAVSQKGREEPNGSHSFSLLTPQSV